MPDPDDLEAVRARVRTAVDRWTGTDTLVLDKADVLALLAPTLTEDEQLIVGEAREAFRPGDDAVSWPTYLSQRMLAIIDRLSGSTSTGGPTEQHDENCPAVCPWVGGDCYAPEHDDHACSCPASAGGPSDG